MDSADLTCQLPRVLHTLRAGARAAKAAVAVIDRGRVKGPGNEISLGKRDMLRDCAGVFDHGCTMHKLSKQSHIIWDEERTRLMSKAIAHGVRWLCP